jgi:hypothetical protein
MAKARKRRIAKRPARKKKAKRGAPGRKKQAQGIGKRLLGAIQLVAEASAETAAMRRKMKSRSPMDEG